MAAEHRKTYRETIEKAMLAIDRRAELLGLVEAYRGLKRHLGLMDFSDQIALAARLAERVPRGRRDRARASSRSCCSTSTRTPRSPRR